MKICLYFLILIHIILIIFKRLKIMATKTISNICNNSKEDNVLIHSELLDNMWKDRASVLMNTIIDMLLFKRDKHKKVITVDLIHDSLMLQNIYNV